MFLLFYYRLIVFKLILNLPGFEFALYEHNVPVTLTDPGNESDINARSALICRVVDRLRADIDRFHIGGL